MTFGIVNLERLWGEGEGELIHDVRLGKRLGRVGCKKIMENYAAIMVQSSLRLYHLQPPIGNRNSIALNTSCKNVPNLKFIQNVEAASCAIKTDFWDANDTSTVRLIKFSQLWLRRRENEWVLCDAGRDEWGHLDFHRKKNLMNIPDNDCEKYFLRSQLKHAGDWQITTMIKKFLVGKILPSFIQRGSKRRGAKAHSDFNLFWWQKITIC